MTWLTLNNTTRLTVQRTLTSLVVLFSFLGPITGAYATTIDKIQQIAHNAGGNTSAPWEGGLQHVQKSLTGTTAQSVAAILICLTGLGIGFGMGGDMLQKSMKVVLGLSIAFKGAGWIAPAIGMGAIL